MNLIILSLLITNIWIFLYNNILFYLRLKIPSPSIADFIVVWPKPEPSEIPLYLGLTLFSTLIIFFLYNYVFGNLKKTNNLWAKLAFLLILIFVFLNNLGPYPLRADFFPYSNKEPEFVNLLFFLIYLGSILSVFLISYAFYFFQKNKKISVPIIFILFILLTIAFFTFEPKFPISPHDYSFFFGPIYEVAQGKTLFAEATSQYGYFSILFLAFLYKLGIVTFPYLPAFIWILYIIEYFICFFIVYKISKSKTLALITLFSIITLNYYSLYHLPISIPQVGSLRWIPLIASALFFLLFNGFHSKKFPFITAFLSFWVVDSGLALLLACGLTIFYFWLGRVFDFLTAIKKGLLIAASIIIVFFSINFLGIFFGYRFNDIWQIFLRVRQYSQAGFGMLPMETHTYFWIVIQVYFLSVVYFFAQKKRDISVQFLLFIANLSLTASIYYIGRTHPHNLFNISIFPLLNLFILLSLLLKNESLNFKLLTYIFLFFLLIVIPSFNRKETLTKMIKQKVKLFEKGRIFTSDFDRLLKNRFREEANLIRENLTDEEVAILSIDDTFLLYLTGKRNLLSNNPQIAATSYEDLKFTLQKASVVCPQKIAIDCRAVNKCSEFPPLNESSIFMPPLLLNELQIQCRSKYIPGKCTHQLCIAVSQKNNEK